MTLAEILSNESPEEQAAAKAAVLQWLRSDNDKRRRLAVEKYPDVADADRAATAAGERKGYAEKTR